MTRFSTLMAGAACATMAATPVAAAEMPVLASPASEYAPAKVYDGEAENGERHRRYRRYRHRRNRVDAGDVIAGVLVLGTIAAIAGSAKNKRDRRYEDRYPDRREDYRYRDRDDRYRDRDRNYRDYRGSDQQGSGMNNAVRMCVNEVERGNTQVAAVDNASRTGDGWSVSGQLAEGGGFSCQIDNDGRIRNVDVGGSGGYSAYDAPVQDNQYDDETYRSARAEMAYAQPEVSYSGTQ